MADLYTLAVDLYTQAMALDPTNPDLFADRAHANIKLNKFTEAVADASKAIDLDASLAKAFLRKGKDAAPEDTSTQAPLVIPSKPKYRHEFYQKPEEVVVSIFAKGIQASWVTVGFGEQTLSVSVEVPGEDGYHFQPRLFGKIKPDECKYNILSTKVEFRLAKAEPGLHWASLEYNKQTAVVQRIAVSSEIAQKPTYPSSKPKRVDWDKIEAQVKKEEKEEKLDGDAALNSFFRGIYQDADEDTRRAMEKSFGLRGKSIEMAGSNIDLFWNHVVKMNDGSLNCGFCGHPFAKDTSISTIKWHFSGEEGHGVAICRQVPKHVQEAAFLAMHGGRRRYKIIASSRNGQRRKRIEMVPSKSGWTLLMTSLIIEIASAVFDQLGYALVGMVLAFVALLLSTADLIHMAGKERMSLLPIFHRTSTATFVPGKPAGTIVEYFGLVGAVWQCVYSTVAYAYARQKKDNPIKMSLLPLIFFSCVVISKLNEKSHLDKSS